MELRRDVDERINIRARNVDRLKMFENVFPEKRHWLLIPMIFLCSFTGNCGPETNIVHVKDRYGERLDARLTAIGGEIDFVSQKRK